MEHAVAGDARDVRHDVQPAELVEGGLDRLLHVVFRGDVARDGDAVAARLLDQFERFVRRLDVKVVDDDLRAAFSEGYRHRLPDAAPCSGDHRYFSV